MKQIFKRILSVLMVFVLVLACAPVMPITVNAATSGTCGDNLTWTLDDAGTLIISGTGAMKDSSSSSSPAPWYNSRSSIKSVIIEEGVTSIGSFAFWDCSSLTSVEIPDSVTSIGNDAFKLCSSLTSVTIGNGVTSIGDRAFSQCSNLTSVTIPDSVTSIGRGAFLKCSSLTSVTIGNGVTSIGDSAFYKCSSLTSVTIPDSVTSIGDSAFSECSSLTSVEIPDSVTSIGSNAFKLCSSLTSVVIPDSVTSIGYWAFDSCSSLTGIWVDADNTAYCSDEQGVLYNKAKTTLIQAPAKGITGTYTIPDSVTSIGNSAFDRCSSLTSVTIPDSVTSIGDGAFWNCSSLTSVVIGDSVTSIGNSAFDYCSSLTSVTIPDSVTSIGSGAFSGCSSLTSVVIGDSVTSIGGYAFDYCSSLTGIWVDADNTAYCSDEQGVLYNKDKTTLIQAPAKGITGTYSIPDSVTSINNYAFRDCSSLTSIEIPDSVTSVSDYAFDGCSSLTSVTIPDSVTSIGDGAFRDCSSLTSIEIPDSVTSIGSFAFSGCSSLTSVEIPDSVTSIGGYAFQSCSSLTSVVIPDSVTSIGSGAFPSCSSLTSVTIGNSVTSIGSNAFSSCSSLTSVVIPDSVTSIGSYAFYNCPNLKDVYYGGNAAQKNNIKIGSANDSLLSAIWHYTNIAVQHKQDDVETYYDTLEEALAVTGGTIQLLTDVTADTVNLNANVTLDLNGYTLTANSVSGKVMDSKDGEGLIKVSAQSAVLSSNDDQLILWDNATDNSGYRVFNYTFTNMGLDTHKDDASESAKVGMTVKSFWSDLVFTNSYAYTLAASTYSGLEISFRVSFTPASGTATGKTFQFTPTVVKDWALAEESNLEGKNYCFYLRLTGFEDLQASGTVEVTPMMKTAFNSAEAGATELHHNYVQPSPGGLEYEVGFGEMPGAVAA